MRYTVNCQEGCGRHLAWLDLPDSVPLAGKDKGFLCEDCARKIAESSPKVEPSPLSAEQRERLEALKTKIGPLGQISAADLEELLTIATRR